MLRARASCPCFVDVRARHLLASTSTRIEEAITPRTRAILSPNLIGNGPDWDAIRADRRPPRPRRDRGLLPTPSAPRLRGTPTGERSTSAHELRPLAHHHRRRQRRHGVRRRRGARRPLPDAAPLGSAQRGAALRLAAGRGRDASSRTSTASRVRQPVHLRRGRLELRALGAGRRLRTRAAREARRQPGPPPAHLRRLTPILRPVTRRVRAAPPHRRARDRLAHVPADHPAGVRPRAPTSRPYIEAGASTPARSGPATSPASRWSEAPAPSCPRTGSPTPTW